MASGPRIVHKQFNSPIGLYSPQNIEATLNKHVKNLGNGTQGIDFSNSTSDKPVNLANSAVLRLLEEQEREKRGYPNAKKVVWPPTYGHNGYSEQQPQQQPQNSAPYGYQGSQQQTQPSWQKPAYDQTPKQYQRPAPTYQKPTQQLLSPTQQYIAELESPKRGYAPSHQQNSVSEGRRQEQAGINRLIPVGPGVNVRSTPSTPSSFSPRSQGHYNTLPSRWGPVSSQSPQLSPNYGNTQPYQNFQEQFTQEVSKDGRCTTQQYSAVQQIASQGSTPFSPPGSSVTLRPFAPIHQKPSQIFSSQPATASYQGGPTMRGDQKWPPQSVKEAVQAENEARRQLARGPACRPRKPNRDYTEFFSKNALNSNYVGYHVPPGTQHFTDYSGQSSF